ncbi:MAG: hypothetical protein ACLPND_01710 [Candidatus Korobacteraceae bacterium]|jgi:hypothetical protein
MNNPRKTQSTTSEQVVYEPCPCREVVNTIRELLGISPAVRQHLANSRVEFLKAVRQVIDDRIEHLSSQGQPGTKVAVE